MNRGRFCLHMNKKMCKSRTWNACWEKSLKYINKNIEKQGDLETSNIKIHQNDAQEAQPEPTVGAGEVILKEAWGKHGDRMAMVKLNVRFGAIVPGISWDIHYIYIYLYALYAIIYIYTPSNWMIPKNLGDGHTTNATI